MEYHREARPQNAVRLGSRENSALPLEGMSMGERSPDLSHRLACRDDLPMLAVLMDTAIGELQKPFLNEKQIASSRMTMGLDTQLIDDGTYFVVEVDGVLAGCGGWSRRTTLYGGDHSP